MQTSTKALLDTRPGLWSSAQEPVGSSDRSFRKSAKVSVCMPVSRNTKWFRQALLSVLAQSMQDIEIVITDDSGGRLASIVDRLPDFRVRYYANPRQLGFAGNHCRAIELSGGDYIAFLHDDDEWDTDYLARAGEVLDRNQQVGLVLCGAQEIDASDRLTGLRPARMSPGLQPDPLKSFLRTDFMLMLPSVALFRRAALQSNRRPWPNVISADITMFIDAVLCDWKVYHVSEPLVRYRIHDGQISANDLETRTALVAVWTGYKFSDDCFELGRKRVLAQCLISRAGAWLRRGNRQAARKDLVDARLSNPATSRIRWLALWVATVVPFRPSIHRKLHDWLPRKHRHAGT